MGVLPGNIIETFQSTLLMRGATALDAGLLPSTTFQSTLLMRGATKQTDSLVKLNEFQSTLLMRGATRIRNRSRDHHQDFNPRSSCEERPHIYH